MKIYKFCKIDQNTFASLTNKTIYFSSVLDWDDPADMYFLVTKTDTNLRLACKRLSDYVCLKKVITHPSSKTIFLPENSNSLFVHVKNQGDVLTHDGYLLGQFVLQNNIGVTCFSLDGNNPVLFSQYADHHRGICLEFEASDEASFYKVNYDEQTMHHVFSEVFLNLIGDNSQIVPKTEALQPFLHKHNSWSYQKEVRIFNFEGPNTTKKIDDLNLKLTKVIFGMRVNENVRMAIRNSVSSLKNVDFYEYIRTGIEGDSYWKITKI